MIQTRVIQFKRRLAQASTLALALLGSVIITAAGFTGSANAAASDCNNSGGNGDIACFWIDTNFSGLRTDYYFPGFQVCHNFSSTFNDQISSVYNKTGFKMMMYQNANCSGINRQLVYPQSTWNIPSSWNDLFSSFRME